MKKLLYLVLLMISVGASAQKLSEFPVYYGDPKDALFPITLNNTNRNVPGSYIAQGKIDSISVGMGSQYDTLWVWKMGIKRFYKLTRASSALSSTSDLPEGSNLYFTQARARSSLGYSSGLVYNPSTGIFGPDYSVLDPRYTTNLQIDETLTYNEGVLGVNRSKLGGIKTVVGDANYTIGVTDATIVLPDPSSTRTINLPAASTMQRQTLKIICMSTSNGEWVLMGSFVQTATTGSSPFIENFSNSGLAAGQRLQLESINDNGTWRWFDTY